MTQIPHRIAVVGSGPAGLMAATILSRTLTPDRAEIHLFEKRPGLGRKLLIAGSSGLNISHGLDASEFATHFEGWSAGFWEDLFAQYGAPDWIRFIQDELKLETFLGTSNRYFVREMKASGLLKRWTELLSRKGVVVHAHSELSNFAEEQGTLSLSFQRGTGQVHETFRCQSAIFALGGASWEAAEPAWAQLFRNQSIPMEDFSASNVGYEVGWTPELLQEAEGKPLKKVLVSTTRGQKLGEMVITKYGLEGTPIYFCGVPGPAYLDLKPDLTEAEIFKRLSKTKENLSPMRRVKHFLGLSPAAESLLFHYSSPDQKADLQKLIAALKKLPLLLKQPRPLSESISSRGGVSLTGVDAELRLKIFPNIWLAGEMLAWDAPTGGFLIQASVSQGAFAARSLLKRFS